MEFRSWGEIRATLWVMALAGAASVGLRHVGPCAGGFVVLAVVGVVELVSRRTRVEAWIAYHAALSRLAVDPGNPECRDEALRLGRRYCEASRDICGRGGYPESRVSKDIAAHG